MIELTEAARTTAGIVLLTVVAVESGGAFLLRVVTGGVATTDLQRRFYRAGHAHAGVLVTLGLVCLLLAEATSLAGGGAVARADRGAGRGDPHAGRVLLLRDGRRTHPAQPLDRAARGRRGRARGGRRHPRDRSPGRLTATASGGPPRPPRRRRGAGRPPPVSRRTRPGAGCRSDAPPTCEYVRALWRPARPPPAGPPRRRAPGPPPRGVRRLAAAPRARPAGGRPPSRRRAVPHSRCGWSAACGWGARTSWEARLAASGTGPATSTRRTAATGSASPCSRWRSSWPPASGGAWRGRPATSSTRSSRGRSAGSASSSRWCCSGSRSGCCATPTASRPTRGSPSGSPRSASPRARSSTSPPGCRRRPTASPRCARPAASSATSRPCR